MEVHAHTHTARKKWTHYFWEFLMLFLAVFLGFLAENQREHYIENQRARAYAQSLLKDLQSDTTDIRTAEQHELLTERMIDSLVDFTGNANVYSKGGQLYYYIRLATAFYNIDWSKATLNQLINSGNLRYFTNHELVNLISIYNTTSNTIISLENTIAIYRDRANAYRDQVIKARHFQYFLQLKMDDVIGGRKLLIIDSLRNLDLPLQSKDPALINNFLNALVSTKANRQFLRERLYTRAIKEAVAIMELLQKEYHLK